MRLRRLGHVVKRRLQSLFPMSPFLGPDDVCTELTQVNRLPSSAEERIQEQSRPSPGRRTF